MKYTKRFWTIHDDLRLVDLFPDNYTSEVCKILNRSYSSVAMRATMHGLKKSESFRKMELSKQAERLKVSGVAHRYQKGSIPLNKGQKMSAEVYEKTKGTMFKKGNVPHNTNYDGHERISKDGYIEIRVSKGVYRFKHRVEWEKVHGAIPEGNIIRFKDGNKLNTSPDNLYMISQRENMDKNTIHRYPAEVKEVIRLVTKLKKKINGKEQNQ